MSKKRILGVAAVSMACCLATMGCGLLNRGDVDPDEPIVGNDWRTTGYYPSASFQHEEYVETLIVGRDQRVTFYYDSPNQVEYQTVYLPFETAAVDDTVFSINPYDINGDGYTDFTLNIYDQAGNYVTVDYVWDIENVMFAEDFVSDWLNDNGDPVDPVDSGDFTFMNFIGAWTPANHEVEILIDSAGNWQVGGNEEMTGYGYTQIEYGTVLLYLADGRFYTSMVYQDGTLIDREGETFYYDGPVEEHLNGDSFVYTDSSYNYGNGEDDGSFLLEGYYYYQGDDSMGEYIYIYDGFHYDSYGYVEGDAEMVILDSGYLVATDDSGNYTAYSTFYDDGAGCEVFQFDTGTLIWGDSIYEM